MNTNSQTRIKDGWKRFISGQSADGYVRDEILRSWERCKSLGSDYNLTVPYKLTDKESIQNKLRNNALLLEVSVPAIQYLYDFLQGAPLFVAVSDAEGYLIGVYGDTSRIDPSYDITYTLWSEKSMGTNPIGTSLAEDRAVTTSGFEHYSRFPHKFSGAGTTIHDADGKVIGAISITNFLQEPNPHALALIVMTAYSIEKQLRLKESNKNIETAYEHVNIIINSIIEGIILLNQQGNISLVNNALLKQLNVPPSRLLGRPITEFVTDKLLVQAIESNAPFTDFITKLNIGKAKYPCVISKRVVGDSHQNENVLIINEFSRFSNIASKISSSQVENSFDTIIGSSPAIKHAIEEARLYSESDSNILILGESGTGKDVFAQAIHNESSRRNGPYVPINCGAIQKELILSELFGYEEGAFTGARSGGAIGKLEYASGGTVFLDEIGEMPLDVQPVLLRALEQMVITRVGGKDYIPIDVRIIAATNKNLEEAIEEGTFRRDLYYRLNLFTVDLVPLRNRREDIFDLVGVFISSMNLKYGKAIKGFSREAMNLMLAYDWPGNVRELKNCVERCVALARNEEIEPELLPSNIWNYNNRNIEESRYYANPIPAAKVIAHSREDDEYRQLKEALEKHHWNITAVSSELGVTRATVYNRMKKFGLN